ELDARTEAPGLGALRHPRSGGSHECSLSPRTPFMAKPLSAVGEVGEKGEGGFEGATSVRRGAHTVRTCQSLQASRPAESRRSKLRKRLDPFQLGTRIERKLQRIARMANRRLSPKALQPTTVKETRCAPRDVRSFGYILKWLDRGRLAEAGRAFCTGPDRGYTA